MATDNSELSFVRCTSCRSLIPAVSTRCRMCGAAVQPQESDSSQSKRTPRIRQKTVAISNGLAGLEANQEDQSAEEIINEAGAEALEEEEAAEDPMSNYIQEIGDDSSDESGDEEGEDSDAVEPKVAVPDVDTEDDDFIQDDEDDAGEPFAKQAAATAVKEEKKPVNAEKFAREDESKHSEGKFKLPLPSSGVKVFGNRQKAPPVVIESEEEQEIPADIIEDTVSVKESFHSTDSDSEQGFNNYEVSNKSEVNTMEKEDINENGVRRIFGWLVSYATPEGKSYEIRESKFFITNKALKQNDFIVNDRSVSTPHAMVHVTRSGGFLVQDLMSDRGMFVRRKGADTYQREESIIKCGHGDWIRVGDVEYLLSIVGDVSK